MEKTHRNVILIALVAACSFSLAANSVAAQSSLAEQERALNMIADFADRLCKDIPLEGEGDNVELSGKAKVELSGIIKKIADLGVEGAAKYQKTEYKGLLQKDLVRALQDSTNCRLQVWNDLKEKILGPNHLGPPPVPQKLPYVIFDEWGNTRLHFGTFESDSDCLDALIAARRKLDSHNASRCARLPLEVWCVSTKDKGQPEAYKDCYMKIQECEESLALHKMEAEIGGKRVMTSCEQLSGHELLAK
ncbi:hypothetical protein [Petrachloros mirabilis]